MQVFGKRPDSAQVARAANPQRSACSMPWIESSHRKHLARDL